MAISLEPRAAGVSVGAARGASDPRFGRAQPAINAANAKRSAFAWPVGRTRRFCMVGGHDGAIPGRPERHGQSESDPTFVGCAVHQANDMRESVTAIAIERPETGLRRMAWARYTPRDGGRSLGSRRRHAGGNQSETTRGRDRRAALEAVATLRALSVRAGHRTRSFAATNRPAPRRACARRFGSRMRAARRPQPCAVSRTSGTRWRAGRIVDRPTLRSRPRVESGRR
jgi:hypothetical protein